MLQTLCGFCHLQKVRGLRGTDAVLPVSSLDFNMFQPHITRPLPPVSSGLRVCPDQTPTLLSTQLTLRLQPFTDTCQPCSGSSARSSENRLLCRLRPPAFPAVLALWGPFLTPPWRREWLPTPVFLPGEPHGQRSLAGYSPWRHKESDMSQQLTLSFSLFSHPCLSVYSGPSVPKLGNSVPGHRRKVKNGPCHSPCSSSGYLCPLSSHSPQRAALDHL